jgi:nucleotide-binding universal stress UspA family protein
MGKILCATRGGEAAIENQKQAIQRALTNDDDLIFFYVVDVEFMAHADYAIRPDIVTGEMDKMAEFLMAMAVERAEKAGQPASFIVRHGNFVEKLKDTIQEQDITLVVLGRPAEESAFELQGLRDLASSVAAETGVDVWIPGSEFVGDDADHAGQEH